jgi:hypothetical protein
MKMFRARLELLQAVASTYLWLTLGCFLPLAVGVPPHAVAAYREYPEARRDITLCLRETSCSELWQE